MATFVFKSRVMGRVLATVMVMVLGCLAALAQPRNFKMTAEGNLVDSKTSEPLFAATVKVVSADGGTGTFCLSDSVGHFAFEVDHPGKYNLEITFVGYKSLNKEINVWPGRGSKLGTFKMEEDQK